MRPSVRGILTLVGLVAAGCGGGAEPASPTAQGTVGGAPQRSTTGHRPTGGFEVSVSAMPGSTQAISLGDCDGDGRLDAVLGVGPNVAVQRADGVFEQRPGWLSSERPTTAAVMVDVDRDGVLDVVSAGDGAWAQVHRGMGGCRFELPRRIAEPVGGQADQVMATDVDGDGVIDLAVTRRRLTDPAVYRLLLGRGDGSFEAAEAPSTPSPVMTGRGFETFVVFFADADDDGAADQWGLVDNQGSWFAWGDPTGAMRFTPDPALTEAFVSACPMSVSGLDFDRDGRADWFLSGTSRRNMLLRGEGPRSLTDVSGPVGVRGAGDAFSWGSYAFDVDLDGWVDVIALQQSPDTPAMDPRDVALWVNQRGEAFDDWGPEVVGARSTALGLACGDLAGDGRVGCLAQADGGAMVMRSRVEPEGRWVGLRFAPTVSASATGATVTVEGASPPIVQRVDAQVSVYGHHDPGLVLAAGDRERVDLTVTWPSGLVQRLRDVATNGYVTATEPEALTLSTRVAPADGSARVEVRVAGAGAAVTIEREGEGAWEGDAVTGGDGVTRRSLVAPASAGEARVTVTIGGAALRVRPVVRFR